MFQTNEELTMFFERFKILNQFILMFLFELMTSAL